MRAHITAGGEMQILPETPTDEYALRLFMDTAIDDETKSWKPGTIKIVMTDAMAEVMNPPAAPSFAPATVKPTLKESK